MVAPTSSIEPGSSLIRPDCVCRPSISEYRTVESLLRTAHTVRTSRTRPTEMGRPVRSSILWISRGSSDSGRPVPSCTLRSDGSVTRLRSERGPSETINQNSSVFGTVETNG
jgi:hypothetical protein